MNRLIAANLLVLALMMAQLLTAFALTIFGAGLSSVFTSVTGLMVINQAVVIFLPTAMYAFVICKSDNISLSDFFRLNPLSGKNITLIVLMCIAVQPLMSVLSVLSSFFFTNDVSDLAMTMIKQVSYGEMVLLMALLPAVFEEAALRGAILYSYGSELGFKRTILINGLLFGMLHLNGHQFLYAVALGAFFAYLVLKTNSLFAGIIGHFTINFSQTTLVSLISAYMDIPEYESHMNSAEPGIASEYDTISSMGALSSVIALLSALIYICAVCMLFRYLLKKFNALNPGTTAAHSTKETDTQNAPALLSAALSTARSENASLEGINAKRLQAVFFYFSLALAAAAFFIFMFITDVTLAQTLFLLVSFSFIFFVFFLLRVRG